MNIGVECVYNSKINKLVFRLIWEKRQDYMKDEKVVDQSIRWPRIHKQKETKKIGKITSSIIPKKHIGK